MNETLVIYLHADDITRPSWAVISNNNEVTQHAWRDSPDALQHIAEDKQVIVIVPGEDVLVLKTQLPPMNHRKLLQALPFALEEQLIDDVEQLHFVPHAEQGNVNVAIVKHHKMQQWLSQLSEWQIKPNALLPVFFLMPYEKQHWHALAMNHTLFIKTEMYYGLACDLSNALPYLQFAMSETIEPPTQLLLHNFTQHDIAFPQTILVNEKQADESQLIVELAKHCNQSSIDLLQGKYAAKKNHLPKLTVLTKSLTYLTAAWILFLFLSPIISYSVLHQRVAANDAELQSIYQYHFPHASTMVAPKLRLQEKLQRLSLGTNDTKVLTLIAKIGQGLTKSPHVKLKRMTYQNAQLTLDVNAETSDDIAALSDYLAQQGLTVKQTNVNLASNRVNTTLIINE